MKTVVPTIRCHLPPNPPSQSRTGASAGSATRCAFTAFFAAVALTPNPACLGHRFRHLGPGLGLIALRLIGAGNVLTTAGLSESIVRLGDEARGRTTFPAVAVLPWAHRLSGGHLRILTMWFTALVGGMLGFIDVMAGLSHTSQVPWLLGLSVVIVALNARRSLGFSVMLLLGSLTFVLLLTTHWCDSPHGSI